MLRPILPAENVKNRGVAGAIDERVTGQVAELVQTLVRNACVNDGSPDTDVIWWAGRLPDAVEGIMSFLEKRAPQWQVSKHVEWPKELGLDA